LQVAAEVVMVILVIILVGVVVLVDIEKVQAQLQAVIQYLL
jgi:hypothetical protein